MNLHGIVSPFIAAVNPLVPVQVQVSVDYVTAASGARKPAFATPGLIIGSLAGDVLTVTAATQGRLMPGQALSGDGIDPATTIVGSTAPNPGAGGVGTYLVSRAQTVPSGPISTSLTLPAQIQAMGYRDLAQIEGLNLNGERRGVYFPGAVAGVMRWSKKGGDLLIFPDGSLWLTAMVLEQWPDWCKVACTRQNATIGDATAAPMPRS